MKDFIYLNIQENYALILNRSFYKNLQDAINKLYSSKSTSFIDSIV
jgi:hypothetical protein